MVGNKTLRRQLDRGDDLARIEAAVALRGVAGQPVKIRKRNYAVTRGAGNMNLRFEHRQRNAHVGRVRRDAGIAGAEDRVSAILAFDGGTATARLSFVARQRGVVEIGTARALQEVAAR